MCAIADSAQALADGDAEHAEKAARESLAAIDRGAAGTRATVALGLAVRDLGRFAEAAEILGRVEPTPSDGVLAATVRFARAQALFYSGVAVSAAPVFERVAQSKIDGLARRARWREADSLLEAGDAAGAVRAYRSLLAAERGPPSAGARLALATALRLAGESASSVEMLRALWIDFPTDPVGRAAARTLRAWREAGGPVPPPTADQRLARAVRFLDLALPRRAIRVLDRLDATHPEPERATRSKLFRAMALVQLGRRVEARALAVQLQTAPAAQPGTRTGAELILARAAARAGRTMEASRRYRALARSRDLVPGLPPLRARELPEDARYLAAWLWFEAGSYQRAIEEFRAYVRERPSAARADDARWFEAWSLYRLGRRDQALAAFARLARGSFLPASLYWQARLQQDPARQRELYGRVLREAQPGSWYALLAADRLARLGERPDVTLAPFQSPTPTEELTAAQLGLLQDAVNLLSVGLRADALAALRALPVTKDPRLLAGMAAELAAAAGDAEIPFRVARDLLPTTRRSLRWLYPVAFEPLISRSAAEAGCDLDLYLALMRRESAFRPDARSGAGAIGLVQLIPPTAERLAALHGVPARDVRLLEEPAVSAPLGAAYLSLLIDRFGEPAIALAAYNAGPPQALAWARTRGGAPLDEWVEGIPYRETRRYVKNVLADAAVYRSLWHGGALALDGTRAIPPPAEGIAF
jgi:soluble lytic murein transglycosylase